MPNRMRRAEPLAARSPLLRRATACLLAASLANPAISLAQAPPPIPPPQADQRQATDRPFPAKYGVSGVMTFIVNHEGVIYQKDLGPRTTSIAAKMQRFEPDPSWKKT